MRAARILIIDDQPETLQSVVVALRAQSWLVSTVSSGLQGFHRATALCPDLILLDHVLPDMDGMTVCRLLRASSATRHTPIVFLSAVEMVQNRVAGLEQGASDYIVKPCEPVEVVARVRAHLRNARINTETTDEPPELLSDDEVMVRAAMRFISEHLADLPQLDAIARHVGTHDKKLSVIFRRQLGMTVFAWVREERLRKAREWLAESNMSIADIADQVGFKSAANFATAFRRRTGVAPTTYRQNARHQDP